MCDIFISKLERNYKINQLEIQYRSYMWNKYHVQRLALAYTKCLIAKQTKQFYFITHLNIKKCNLKIFHLFLGDTRLKRASTDGQEIIIQVSDNILHQITSRIFGTLATEFLNENVIYKDVQYPPETSETDKLFETFKDIVEYVKEFITIYQKRRWKFFHKISQIQRTFRNLNRPKILIVQKT